MTGRAGEIRDDELYIRCPSCGDSDSDPTKAHCSINLRKFVFYCFRCGDSGRLTTRQAFSLLSNLNGDFDFRSAEETEDDELPDVLPGAGSSRASKLQRFHYIDQNQITWDAFQMRQVQDNQVTGYHMRYGKQKYTFGDKTAEWIETGPLISSVNKPITLVEGPYDVVYPNWVSVYGLLNRTTVSQFKGHYINLCPDGDCWSKFSLLSAMIRTLDWLLNNQNKIYLCNLIVLPNNTDPDEATDFEVVPREHILRTLEHMANLAKEQNE